MFTVLDQSRQVSVPDWVLDLESFRRWADADDLPEHCRIWYLKGEVWIDMSKEQIFSHALLKTAIIIVLGGLVRALRKGLFFADGPFFSNPDADIAGNPDAIFVSNASLRNKRVRLVEGMEEGFVELEGSPDMMLEVVSPSSVRKDTVILRQAYWEAGIREYWLVDGRTEELSFEILRWSSRGFVAVRPQKGWLRSTVFKHSFRLRQRTTSLGHPEYTLDVS
jgi:Uma2 family endonuclease